MNQSDFENNFSDNENDSRYGIRKKVKSEFNPQGLSEGDRVINPNDKSKDKEGTIVKLLESQDGKTRAIVEYPSYTAKPIDVKHLTKASAEKVNKISEGDEVLYKGQKYIIEHIHNNDVCIRLKGTRTVTTWTKIKNIKKISAFGNNPKVSVINKNSENEKKGDWILYLYDEDGVLILEENFEYEESADEYLASNVNNFSIETQYELEVDGYVFKEGNVHYDYEVDLADVYGVNLDLQGDELLSPQVDRYKDSLDDDGFGIKDELGEKPSKTQTGENSKMGNPLFARINNLKKRLANSELPCNDCEDMGDEDAEIIKEGDELNKKSISEFDPDSEISNVKDYINNAIQTHIEAGTTEITRTDVFDLVMMDLEDDNNKVIEEEDVWDALFADRRWDDGSGLLNLDDVKIASIKNKLNKNVNNMKNKLNSLRMKLNGLYDNPNAKYPSGKHYSDASHALKSEYGLLGVDENGEPLAHGTISKNIADKLQSIDTKMDESGENFIVSYDEYSKLVNEFLKEREQYIEDNNLEITPLFKNKSMKKKSWDSADKIKGGDSIDKDYGVAKYDGIMREENDIDLESHTNKNVGEYADHKQFRDKKYSTEEDGMVKQVKSLRMKLSGNDYHDSDKDTSKNYNDLSDDDKKYWNDNKYNADPYWSGEDEYENEKKKNDLRKIFPKKSHISPDGDEKMEDVQKDKENFGFEYIDDLDTKESEGNMNKELDRKVKSLRTKLNGKPKSCSRCGNDLVPNEAHKTICNECEDKRAKKVKSNKFSGIGKEYLNEGKDKLKEYWNKSKDMAGGLVNDVMFGETPGTHYNEQKKLEETGTNKFKQKTAGNPNDNKFYSVRVTIDLWDDNNFAQNDIQDTMDDLGIGWDEYDAIEEGDNYAKKKTASEVNIEAGDTVPKVDVINDKDVFTWDEQDGKKTAYWDRSRTIDEGDLVSLNENGKKYVVTYVDYDTQHESRPIYNLEDATTGEELEYYVYDEDIEKISKKGSKDSNNELINVYVDKQFVEKFNEGLKSKGLSWDSYDEREDFDWIVFTFDEKQYHKIKNLVYDIADSVEYEDGTEIWKTTRAVKKKASKDSNIKQLVLANINNDKVGDVLISYGIDIHDISNDLKELDDSEKMSLTAELNKVVKSLKKKSTSTVPTELQPGSTVEIKDQDTASTQTQGQITDVGQQVTPDNQTETVVKMNDGKEYSTDDFSIDKKNMLKELQAIDFNDDVEKYSDLDDINSVDISDDLVSDLNQDDYEDDEQFNSRMNIENENPYADDFDMNELDNLLMDEDVIGEYNDSTDRVISKKSNIKSGFTVIKKSPAPKVIEYGINSDDFFD